MTLPRSTSGTTTVLHGSGVRLAPRLPAVVEQAPQSVRTVFAAVALMADERGRLTASIRELARWSGLSPSTAWRAMRRLTEARLVRRLSVGNTGQESVWEVRWKVFSTGGVPPSQTLPRDKPTRRKSPETSLASSPLSPNRKEQARLGETVSRGLRDVTRDLRRLSLRAGEGSVTRTLAALREELSCQGVDPSLQAELVTAAAVALWRHKRRGVPLAAWNRAHNVLVEEIAALPSEEDERIDGILDGDQPRSELFSLVGHLVGGIFAEAVRWTAGEIARLKREEERLRALAEARRDPLRPERIRELVGAAVACPEAGAALGSPSQRPAFGFPGRGYVPDRLGPTWRSPDDEEPAVPPPPEVVEALAKLGLHVGPRGPVAWRTNPAPVAPAPGGPSASGIQPVGPAATAAPGGGGGERRERGDPFVERLLAKMARLGILDVGLEQRRNDEASTTERSEKHDGGCAGPCREAAQPVRIDTIPRGDR